MMRLFALSMLLLITLGSAQNDAQASPASADYQAGFARGLELGMKVASLQGAAQFNPEAANIYNQTVLEFNLILDEVFGKGSNLSNLYRMQLYGLKADNATNLAVKQAAENITAVNMTAENAITDNATADNTTADNATDKKIIPENHTTKNLTTKQAQPLKNETIDAADMTKNAKETIIPKITDNTTIAMRESIADDFSDVITDWDKGSETIPESMLSMPGPQTT